MAAMPITVGAIRKQRTDKKKAVINTRTRGALREAVLQMRKKPSVANLTKLASQADRAAKKGVIHKNKANRLKSRLARLVKTKKK